MSKKPKALGCYESERHRDWCAETGLLVSRSLGMQTSSPREIMAQVRDMQSALKIIAMWANCDHASGQTRLDAMADIRDHAMEALVWKTEVSE